MTDTNFPSSIENRSGGTNISGGNVTGDVVGRDKNTYNVQGALNALAKLLRENAEARATLGKYRSEVRNVSLQIKKLAAYKTLHDALHNVQLNCYEMLVVMTKDDLNNRRKRRTLKNYAQTVGDTIELVGKCCPPVDSRDVRWVNELDEAHTRLLAGAESEETADEDTAQAISILQRVLTRPPSDINKNIFFLARELPLQETLSIFKELLPFLRSLPSESFNIAAFENGLLGLQAFEIRLQALVNAHDTWQGLIDDVRNVADQPDAGFGLLQKRWPTLSDRTQKARGTEATSLENILDTPEATEKSLKEIADTMQDLATALQANVVDDISDEFDDFRRLVNLLFKRIDDNLKKACDQLSEVAVQPLDKIDELMTA